MKPSLDWRNQCVALVLLNALPWIASTANADFTFGTPINLGSAVNSPARDEEPGISADGLSIYYCSLRPGGHGGYDMWVTTRATTKDDWGAPVNLGSTVNSTVDDFSEDISADGLELYFGSNRSGGVGSYDLWVTRRATKQDAWTTPVNLGSMVNSVAQEGCPAISDDGRELYFWSNRSGGAGGYDIYVSRRATTEDSWGPAENLGPLANSPTTELCTDVSPDGQVLILVSARAGSYGGNLGDLWIARRSPTGGSWRSVTNLGPLVNSANNENGPCLSADGETLYFSSDRPGGSGDQDMWQVSIDPVLDFDGDGFVNITDLLKLIESWGQDDSIVDIAPPLGNGRIDADDLETLMAHWEQGVEDPSLVAHWPLDETEGVIVPDHAGDNDGVVVGAAIWQPAGGAVNGALELDGQTYVTTGFVLSPADGPFSVLVWVKGGQPGQVVVAQEGGFSWLAADTAGTLMTDLNSGGRHSQKLTSQTTITDGDWHRIAFVWDGSMRRLYIDGTQVAADAQSTLLDCSGVLHIGCDRDKTPPTFFAGLIDDVRLYDRTVRP